MPVKDVPIARSMVHSVRKRQKLCQILLCYVLWLENFIKAKSLFYIIYSLIELKTTQLLSPSTIICKHINQISREIKQQQQKQPKMRVVGEIPIFAHEWRAV